MNQQWTIKCEECGMIKVYQSYNSYYEAKRRGRIRCRTCANKKRWNETFQRSKYNKDIYVGKRFGSLTVLSDRIGSGTQVLCKCDCGNEIKKRAQRLLMEKNAGCQKCLVGDKNHLWKGIGQVPKIVFTRIKHHAKLKHKDFNITLKYISQMFDAQDGKCALSGMKLKFGVSNKEEQTASLDRIDSTQGYVIGNVQWVHKYVNWMKQDFSDEEFLFFCKKIVDYRKL